MHDARLLTPGNRMGSRAVPSKRSWEPLYLFVFSHYPTQNRFALFGWKCSNAGGMPKVRKRAFIRRRCGKSHSARIVVK
ncbi:hypothetical protein F9K75_02820 [Brucella intermedia]|nr:hypothetical protein F9K75_02820 [Brucella intermedia]